MSHQLRALFPLILIAVLALAVTNACVHDPVVVIPNDTIPTDTIPNDTVPVDTANLRICDPDTVYFGRQVLPILVSRCGMDGCHSANSHKDGVILVSYSSVMSTGDIEPGKPSSSEIYKVLLETGNDRMPPPPDAALTADEIALIGKWITQGAQNLNCKDGPTCDTAAVSYTTFVLPLLQANCTGCHGDHNPGGGILLNSYEAVVVSANNGKLTGAINHEAGFKVMPPSGTKLPDCDILKVKAWVAAGAKNN
ncbi:MAG: hypothetical protein EAZ89_14415 [Bacteroidetes bacterium]|nr:MAG: hypothetical protein EAZ89_14415 [Bacteroidota bacterium]